MKLVFIDTETTGLDPAIHEMWEFSLIVREDGEEQWTFENQVPANLSTADPMALKIGRLYDRYDPDIFLPSSVEVIAKVLAGATLVGANPSFDAQFMGKFLRQWNQAPAWNHRMVCVENLVAGAKRLAEPVSLLKSAELMGIEVNPQEAHTASYDTHLAMQVYDAVMEGGLMARFESRQDLADKINWEGGLEAAFDYGISSADLPEGEVLLFSLWEEAANAHSDFMTWLEAISEAFPELED